MSVELLARHLDLPPTVLRKANELLRLVRVRSMASSAEIAHPAACIQLAAETLGTPLDKVRHCSI